MWRSLRAERGQEEDTWRKPCGQLVERDCSAEVRLKPVDCSRGSQSETEAGSSDREDANFNSASCVLQMPLMLLSLLPVV